MHDKGVYIYSGRALNAFTEWSKFIDHFKALK